MCVGGYVWLVVSVALDLKGKGLLFICVRVCVVCVCVVWRVCRVCLGRVLCV